MSIVAVSDPNPHQNAHLDGPRVAVVACGAIARHVADIAGRRGWPVDVHPLPPLLHNRPERIAAAVEDCAVGLRSRYAVVAVGFADCGTYGALDEVCARLGLRRLSGSHCYDVFAGAQQLRAMLEDEPGTYLLTDFLALSFRRSVIVELGLDRFPELRADYFRHYRRVVWLAQRPTAELRAAAEAAAAFLALPLEVAVVGDDALEHDLADMLAAARADHEVARGAAGTVGVPFRSLRLPTGVIERIVTSSVRPHPTTGIRDTRGDAPAGTAVTPSAAPTPTAEEVPRR